MVIIKTKGGTGNSEIEMMYHFWRIYKSHGHTFLSYFAVLAVCYGWLMHGTEHFIENHGRVGIAKCVFNSQVWTLILFLANFSHITAMLSRTLKTIMNEKPS